MCAITNRWEALARLETINSETEEEKEPDDEGEEEEEEEEETKASFSKLTIPARPLEELMKSLQEIC